MAKKIKIEIIPEGVRELLNSPEIDAACRDAANRVKAKAGDNFGVEKLTRTKRKDRPRYAVWAIDKKGVYEEARGKKLTKAVNRCRI